MDENRRSLIHIEVQKGIEFFQIIYNQHMTDCIIVIGLPTRFKCGSTIDIPHVIKLRPSIPVLIGSVVCHFGFYLSAACPSFPLVSRSSSGGFRCYCSCSKFQPLRSSWDWSLTHRKKITRGPRPLASREQSFWRGKKNKQKQECCVDSSFKPTRNEWVAVALSGVGLECVLPRGNHRYRKESSISSVKSKDLRAETKADRDVLRPNKLLGSRWLWRRESKPPLSFFRNFIFESSQQRSMPCMWAHVSGLI